MAQERRSRTHLAVAVGPEVHDLADEVVDSGVGALVHDDGGEGQQRHQHQAELDALVHEGAGERLDRQLEREHAEAEDGVDELQDRDGLDGAVEVGGEEVPEDLGPEVALERSGDLVWTWSEEDHLERRDRTEAGHQDDEARPVVLYKLPHSGRAEECGAVARTSIWVNLCSRGLEC
jgi:hypothetical protein